MGAVGASGHRIAHLEHRRRMLRCGISIPAYDHSGSKTGKARDEQMHSGLHRKRTSDLRVYDSAPARPGAYGNFLSSGGLM